MARPQVDSPVEELADRARSLLVLHHRVVRFHLHDLDPGGRLQ